LSTANVVEGNEKMASSPASWLRDTRQYFVEVQSEYKKITWPSQREAVTGATGVVVIVVILTTVLAFVDYLLSLVVGLMFG
jgi:preprotein translocase SecE subunit